MQHLIEERSTKVTRIVALWSKLGPVHRQLVTRQAGTLLVGNELWSTCRTTCRACEGSVEDLVLCTKLRKVRTRRP